MPIALPMVPPTNTAVKEMKSEMRAP